jgi:hypothetical protein
MFGAVRPGLGLDGVFKVWDYFCYFNKPRRASGDTVLPADA